MVKNLYEFDIIRTAESKIDPTIKDSFDVVVDVTSFVGEGVFRHNRLKIKGFVGCPNRSRGRNPSPATPRGDTTVKAMDRFRSLARRVLRNIPTERPHKSGISWF